MIEYGGSTGKRRHCRTLASREPKFTASNIIHLHPKEHVDDQCAGQFPTKSNNHRHNTDSTFYFNQRGQFSVFEESVLYCKGRCVSHKGGSVENSRGRIVLYRESVGNSDDHVEYRKVKLRKECVLYCSKVEYGRHLEYNRNIAY